MTNALLKLIHLLNVKGRSVADIYYVIQSLQLSFMVFHRGGSFSIKVRTWRRLHSRVRFAHRG